MVNGPSTSRAAGARFSGGRSTKDTTAQATSSAATTPRMMIRAPKGWGARSAGNDRPRAIAGAGCTTRVGGGPAADGKAAPGVVGAKDGAAVWRGRPNIGVADGGGSGPGTGRPPDVDGRSRLGTGTTIRWSSRALHGVNSIRPARRPVGPSPNVFGLVCGEVRRPWPDAAMEWPDHSPCDGRHTTLEKRMAPVDCTPPNRIALDNPTAPRHPRQFEHERGNHETQGTDPHVGGRG